LVLLLHGAAADCCAQQKQDGITIQGDSATLAASLRYKDPSFFRRLFLGKNYRKVWATPVTLPLFQMQQMGFTIKELGGGQQTKSLHLLDKQHHEWALRSIDKEVEKALPPYMRHTIAQKITQDMVSAAHPYAPLVVFSLAQATGIVAGRPIYFIVPDDPGLKPYTKLFQNTMCMLEDREPAPDGEEGKNTEEFVIALLKDDSVQVNQEAVLRARLLDMLIGDWDRHQEQWRWAFEKDKGTVYSYAIPRDRDQALFYSNGLLVKLVRVVALKHMVGFSKNTRKLKQLNAKSWNFDRMFLNSLDKAAWSRITQTFTAALTDSVIHEAVKKLPANIYALDGRKIEQKLIARRNSLPKDVLRYYQFLSGLVTITGTDAPERFVVHTSKDSISVQQFTGTDFSQLVYNRTFHRKETYQVTILGLGGADEFVQQPGTASRIRLVIDGGSGTNTYTFKKHRKTEIYNSDLDAPAYLNTVKKNLRIKEESQK